MGDEVYAALSKISAAVFDDVETQLAHARTHDAIDGPGPSMTPTDPGPRPLAFALHDVIAEGDLIEAIRKSSWAVLFKNLQDEPGMIRTSHYAVCWFSGWAFGGCALGEFVARLLTCAHQRVRLNGKAPAVENVASELGLIVSETDQLLEGHAVELPFLHYINGVAIEAGGSIEIGDTGELLPLDQNRWTLLHDNREAWTVDIAIASGVLLVERVSVWLDLEPCFQDFDPNPPTGLKEHRSVLTDLTTAVALTDLVKPIGLRRLSSSHLNHLAGKSVSFDGTFIKGQDGPRVLRDDEVSRLKELLGVIAGADLSSIGLAIDRLVLGLGRNRTSDKMIDGAIGIESLFGEKLFVNHSIAVSLSALLGESEETRLLLFDRWKQLYDSRSKLVHGGKRKGDGSYSEDAEEIMSLLARSIVSIMADPDLQNLTASQRAKKLAVRPRD